MLTVIKSPWSILLSTNIHCQNPQMRRPMSCDASHLLHDPDPRLPYIGSE